MPFIALAALAEICRLIYGRHKGMEGIIQCGRNGAGAVFLNQGCKNPI